MITFLEKCMLDFQELVSLISVTQDLRKFYSFWDWKLLESYLPFTRYLSHSRFT